MLKKTGNLAEDCHTDIDRVTIEHIKKSDKPISFSTDGRIQIVE